MPSYNNHTVIAFRIVCTVLGAQLQKSAKVQKSTEKGDQNDRTCWEELLNSLGLFGVEKGWGG